MTPIQILRVGFGGGAVQVPIYRFVFTGGADSDITPGGFFQSEEGEIGIAVDARLGPEEAQQMIAREIEANLPALEAFTRKSHPGERRSHAS